MPHAQIFIVTEESWGRTIHWCDGVTAGLSWIDFDFPEDERHYVRPITCETSHTSAAKSTARATGGR